MTPALELVVRGREDVAAYACPKCGQVFAPGDAASAAAHCEPRFCACSKPMERHAQKCSDCLRADFEERAREQEEKHFAEATKLKVEEYDGPVYWEGQAGDWGEGYFSSIESLLDACERDELDVPAYAWACCPHDLHLNGDDIISSAMEQQEMHEGAEDSIGADARSTLQQFLDNWCEQHTVTSWMADHTRAVLLHEPNG